MATKTLTVREIKAAKPGSRLHDGDGLVAVTSKSGSTRFVYRFTIAGKTSELGLGSFPLVTLERARELATEARRLHKAGVSPVEHRRKKDGGGEAPEPPPAKPTFEQVAEELIAAKRDGWRNDKHRAQWSSTLKTYAKPIWNIPIDEVDTTAVVAALKPIWNKIPETASRVRGRIESVFAAAQAQGFVDPDRSNPAMWKRKLEFLLPARTKLSRGHHKALPYSEMREFIAQLRLREGPSARALEFLICCAARSGEVLGAKWEEINLEDAVWTIPKERMKGGVQHQVPLTSRAIEILEQMQRERVSDYVFASQCRNGPLSNMSLGMLMRRMNVDAVPHGFRSTFRDWAGDIGHYPRELAEQALAHVIGNKVEAAYRRSTALERRREMMIAWQNFIEPSND